MEKEERDKLKQDLFDLTPQNGDPVGNVTLIEKFQKKTNLSDDVYWDIRNELIDDGKLAKARGKGGSVHRLIQIEEKKPTTKNKKNTVIKKVKESTLYTPFSKSLKDFWTKDNDIKNYVLQITANQGRKDTGGRWTRPDISIIDVKAFSFYPTKILEVTTFEMKTPDNFGIDGVFETAAHSIFAHKSYLAINYLKEDYAADELIDTIIKRCEMFGVGLILFKDPSDWKTVTTVLEAKHNNPDPIEVNQFIKQQIDQDNQHILLEKIK